VSRPKKIEGFGDTMPKSHERCPAKDCTKLGDFCRGFCSHHYLEFRKSRIALGIWGRNMPMPKPELPSRWEFEGDELALIAMTEEQERERRDAPNTSK
jgi:hypothetical protein